MRVEEAEAAVGCYYVASLPVASYQTILLGDSGTYVNNLPNCTAVPGRESNYQSLHLMSITVLISCDLDC